MNMMTGVAMARHMKGRRIEAPIEIPSSVVPLPEDAPRRWYAVHTEPRAEWGVHKELRSLGIDTLYLHYPATVSHARRKIGILRPLFRGYVFVGLAAHQGLLTVSMVRGVSRAIYADGVALEVPARVIEALRKRGDAHGRLLPVEIETLRRLGEVGLIGPDRKASVPLEQGAEVRIKEGPFEGLMAKVALDDGYEVALWLRMFNGLVQAAVPSQAVELVSPAGRLVPARTSQP